jgi:hypothetical protein
VRPEVLLLKPFLQKETYDTYRQYLDPSKEEQEIRQLYNQLDKAHEIYQRDLSFNEFYVHVLSNIVGNQHTIKPILDKLEKYEVALIDFMGFIQLIIKLSNLLFLFRGIKILSIGVISFFL